MNRLTGFITDIKTSGELSLVEVNVLGDIWSAVVLESIAIYKKGQSIRLLFKETEVGLAVDFRGKISFRNQLKCMVKGIERGVVLTMVKLDYKGTILSSIITTASAEMLELNLGSEVTAFVKTNELMLEG